MTHQLTPLRFWLETAAGDRLDVMSAEFSYALNSIPTGTVQLAAGTNVHTNQPSRTEPLVFKATEPIPIVLKLAAEGLPKNVPDAVYLDGTYTLFDGYLQTAGANISPTALGVSGYLSHWLTDLNRGSAISARSHPGNPIQFTFNAAIPDGGGAGGLNYVPITVAQRFFTPANIVSDLWGKAILPWFQDLASKDRISAPDFGTNDDPDESVKKALARFTGEPLPVRDDNVDAVEIARGISEDISASVMTPNNNHFAAMSSVTLWDKLIGDLSPIYHFVVVPGPTWAKVVPFVPGLRGVWNSGETGPEYTIRTRDMDMINQQDELIRPIGGLGLCTTIGSVAGGLPPGETIDQFIGGVYKASDKGMVIIRRAPRWCEKAMLPGGMPIAAGVKGGIPMAGDPGGGAAPAKTVAVTAAAARTLLDRMAHAYYLAEVLRHRNLIIESPLRFDIAPGSNISIQAVTPTQQVEFFVGTVVRVSYSLSISPTYAKTTYTLAHVRRDVENQADATSVENHPIYKQNWVGDYLVRADP